MTLGGVLGGVYGYGGNAGDAALLNAVLDAQGITLTNTILGYMDFFKSFFPEALNYVKE